MKYKIKKDIPLPYYFQIQEYLKKVIKDGTWKTDDYLPSERKLSEQFNVSRITVRKALDNLMIEGLIKKEKGKGAIVAAPKIKEQLLNRLIGVYQDLMEKGFKISNKILDYKVTIPEEFIRDNLKLLQIEKVFYFERLRFINEIPYHFSETYIPQKYFPQFDYKYLIDTSLYKLISEVYGRKIFKIQRILESTIATVEHAKLFKIKTGSPILAFYNTTYTDNETPIEYSYNMIRGDMSKFQVEISSEKVEDIFHKIK